MWMQSFKKAFSREINNLSFHEEGQLKNGDFQREDSESLQFGHLPSDP
jgi:hypothetical protein